MVGDSLKIVSSFGNRIKQYREDNKLTLAEMERITGVPAQTINRYELNQRVPKVDAAAEIANKLNLSPMWLFGYDIDEVDIASNLEKPKTPSSPAHIYRQVSEEFGENCSNALQLYVKLDETDQARITERMTVLLEDEKYSAQSKKGAALA